MEPNTTVILIPGFGEYPETRTFIDLKAQLEQQCYTVISMAWPHYPDDLSKYSFTETLQAARTLIKSLQDNGEQVILHANSMGGILAVILAKEFAVKKLSLTVTPYQAGTEDDLAGKYKEWKESGVREFTSSKYGTLKIPFSFIEDARKYNALDYIEAVQCPMQFVAGELDRNVPWATSKKLYDAATTTEKEWHLLPEMEHKFQYQPEKLKEVNALVIKFISK
jgi:esterase/lipase